jgi:hypothetical protein
VKRTHLLILIALVLLLSDASSAKSSASNKPEQHKSRAAVQAEAAQQQQPQVPLTAFESSQAALLEALRTIKAQAETQREQAGPQNVTWQWLRWLTPLRVQQGLLASAPSIRCLPFSNGPLSVAKRTLLKGQSKLSKPPTSR